MPEEYTYKPIIAFDTETHQLAMCNLVPKQVCMSMCIRDENDVYDTGVQAIMDTDFNAWIEMVVRDGGVGHNTAFNLAGLAGHRPDLLPAIWQGLEEGKFEDTIIREKLLHLAAHGDLEFFTMPQPDGASVTIPLKYSLADLANRYLGVTRDKSGDSWRLRYIELEKQRVEDWPKSAVEYVSLDAEDCLRIREIQESERVKIWNAIGHDPFCTQSFQVGVSFALYLMSAWGFLVDQEAKAKIVAYLEEELKPERMQLLVAAGILRPGTPPVPYKTGAKEKCPKCDGNRKEIFQGGFQTCTRCEGTGQVPRMKKAVEESINKHALMSFISSWAAEQNPPVPLKMTAPSTKHPGGIVSTDIEFFKDHQFDHPIFAEYEHRASLQKLVTTEIPRMSGAILHPGFDVLKKTGRTSSFASKIYPSFNCQNVHPKVRGCFIPRPGNLLFSIDYGGMELGTLAQKVYGLFGHSVHRDKINAGIDNHTFLGSQLAYALDMYFKKACDDAGVSVPDAVYDVFVKCKTHLDENVRKLFKHYRNFAKPTGLGYPGGLGAKTFIQYAKETYGVVVDLPMAERLKAIWHQTYPEMKAYFRWITDSCRDPYHEDKYAYTTPFGMYRAGADFCAAANGAGLQAFSAEGAKLSVFNVLRACTDPSQCSILYGKVHPIAFVHDEIIGEVADNSEAHDLVYEVARLMKESMAVVTPDVNVSCSPVLMKRWSKSAEPVFDAFGRLVPWEPSEKK